MDGGFEERLRFAQRIVLVCGRRERVLHGPQTIEAEEIEHRPATPASMAIPRDREEPGGQIRFVVQAMSVSGEGQPGVLQQILRDGGVAAEPKEEAMEPRAVVVVDLLKGALIAVSQVIELGFSVHHLVNTHELAGCDNEQIMSRPAVPCVLPSEPRQERSR